MLNYNRQHFITSAFFSIIVVLFTCIPAKAEEAEPAASEEPATAPGVEPEPVVVQALPAEAVKPRLAEIIEFPPVSEKQIQPFLDFLTAHMVHANGYTVTGGLSATPGVGTDLEHLTVYSRAESLGVIMAGFRPARIGRLLVLKVTSEDQELLADLAALSVVARAQVQALNADVVKDLLSNAKVVTYDLSYIRLDRALGALKAMGHNVVEMQEAPGIGGAKNYTMSPVTDLRLPIITSVVDSDSTSLAEQKVRAAGPLGSTVTPDIGGSSLMAVTDASAQQRLMICYDPKDEGSYRRLVDDIETVIDLPAQQILIEGLIIEVNEDKVKELGIDYSAADRHLTMTHGLDAATNTRPLTLGYSSIIKSPERFEMGVRALVEQGAADILSKPSILALNNYQARIRIGSEIPISTTVATTATTNLNVSYFFMGIVLNIKPRISRDQKEVSMQVEAIVSSKSTDTALKNFVNGQWVDVAPVIDTRVVQTFARVSNNTPFIIGGLIKQDKREKKTGIPLLMDIPLIGKLFQSTSMEQHRKEVIVVLTPRVVPLESENHFALMPKDSEKFDSSGSKLFRSAYRIRGEDLFDLTFVREDADYIALSRRAAERAKEDPGIEKEPAVQSILDGRIPGEHALMVRMLYEVVRAQKTVDQIDTENIIFFHPRREEGREQEEIKVKYLARELQKVGETLPTGKALVVQFDIAAKRDGIDGKKRLMPPVSIEVIEAAKRADYDDCMRSLNKMRPDGTFDSMAIVIQSPGDLSRLKACLVLKKLLEINNFPASLHVKDFPIGVQILYPNLETQADRKYVVDTKVAELFYLCDYYYEAFQRVYHARLESIEAALGER